MTVRDLKLAIACGHESDEVKSLNKFFDDLFNGIVIYTYKNEPDLFFMKGEKFIMKQNLKKNELGVYNEFWNILRDKYNCTVKETQDIISYKVKEIFNICSLTPSINVFPTISSIEKAFKNDVGKTDFNFIKKN